jgi:predicted flavoprotein YhiN
MTFDGGLAALCAAGRAGPARGNQHRQQKERMAFNEDLLFTHRGLSGPAVLQISSYWKPGTPLHINLA